MAIPVQFLNFKAAGIYRVVYDKSTLIGVDSLILRLVVGYSEKGPFNTPVYVKSQTDFKQLYGGISKKLERRGIFFHRMALQCLLEGPILALNLKKFSNETVDAVTIDLTGNNPVINTQKALVEDIYDTSRFWTLDAHKLNEIRSVYVDEQGNLKELSDGSYKKNSILDGYIKLCATSTKENSCSVFIRPASGNVVQQYKMSVGDWYKAMGEDLPEYFEGLEDTMLSSYFAQIYVFRGKFVPTQVLASDTLSKYFDGYTDENNKLAVKLKNSILDPFGEYIDTLDALFKEDLASPVARYTGALIPYFKDSQGSYQCLDILLNNDNEIHNLMMTFDEDQLDDLGASIIDMSGNKAFQSDGTLNVDFIKQLWSGKATSNSIGNTEAKINSAKTTIKFVEDSLKGETELNRTVDLNDYDNTLFGDDSVMFCQIAGQIDWPTLFEIIKNAPENQEIESWRINEDGDECGVDEEGEWTAEGYEKLLTYLPAEIVNGEPNKMIIVNNDSLPKMFQQGSMIVSTTGETTLVQKVGTFQVGNQLISYMKNEYEDYLLDTSNGYLIRIDGTLNSEIGNMKPYYIEGYTYQNTRPYVYASVDAYGNKEKKFTNTNVAKLNWQNDILSTLTDYKGLRVGLLNKSEIDYRYVIDTFESYVQTSCKSVLSYLCKEKQSAFAILNFPSIQTFRKSENPSFTNANGVFNVQYIVDGYNKKKASSFKFSLPSDSEGASFCAFYTPMKYSDGYVTTIVPSAAVVSNLFMEKYKSRQPYYIIAGPNYGLINDSGMTGPDYNYTMDELQIIEPYGVNCLVYRPGFGTFINANQTAKQTPKSALSSVNVRELVIYLQDEIEALLQSYQWEFNNPTTRQAIKDRADQICERIKANGGIQAYLNIMDESNNTPDIIDNEMAVLSTHIEAGRGMGKMVQELTLYRTGGLSSLIKE